MHRKYAVYARWYEGDQLIGRRWTRWGARALAANWHSGINYVDVLIQGPDGSLDYWWREPRINAD